VFEVGEFRLAAARSGSHVFVLEDRCSHDDGELGQGTVFGMTDEGGEIECPRHGARFDIASGRATRMPAIAPIETFAAKVEGEEVWVELPDYGE
jgi:3-phenylpropionate/trans-cinnamate dioxygenase ferredoxin subunit